MDAPALAEGCREALKRNKVSEMLQCSATILLMSALFYGIMLRQSAMFPNRQEGRDMVDRCLIWAFAHPLEAVGALAGLGALIGIVLIPRVHELAGHGPPRC